MPVNVVKVVHLVSGMDLIGYTSVAIDGQIEMHEVMIYVIQGDRVNLVPYFGIKDDVVMVNEKNTCFQFEAEKKLAELYEGAITKIRAIKSGIVLPQSPGATDRTIIPTANPNQPTDVTPMPV